LDQFQNNSINMSHDISINDYNSNNYNDGNSYNRVANSNNNVKYEANFPSSLDSSVLNIGFNKSNINE